VSLLGDYFSAAGGGGVAGFATLTIDRTKCGVADTTDYPLLVCGTLNLMKSIANGGSLNSVNNVAFYSDAGHTSLLKFERVFHSLTTGAFEYHVKIPTLTVASDLVIYPDIDASNSTDRADPTNVWDSGYKGVYHMGDGSSLVLTDSTANANHGTASGAIVAFAGAFAGGTLGGADSAPAGAYIDLGTNSSLALPGDATIEAWINPQVSPPSNQMIAAVGANTISTVQFGLEWSRLTNKLDVIWGPNPGYDILYQTGTLSGGWHHVAGTRLSTTSARIYIDGVADAGNPQTGTNAGSSFVRGFIGGYYQSSNFTFNGKEDEVRISNVVRSPSYFTATYNNHSSPSTFYTLT
jgi:hypothetical protein